MSTNRLKTLLQKDHFSFTDLLPHSKSVESFFEGPQTYEDLLRGALEKGRQQGAKEAIEKIAKDIQSRLEKYIEALLGIGGIIKFAAEESNIEVKQVRAKVCFDSGSINAFFVITTSFENEVKFSKLLDEAERLFLQEENLLAETSFVNVKENEQSIDYSAVKNDYPFSLNVENVVHAIKQSASSTSKS
ncbi:MAG: hypothetical protein A3G33_02690 [Omnitrophica bacterium RIFCSPLOWO2_12_FULL_44_17]|uniref:Uncharacterized protein n=1 Tax=Candidatus Danuiimicrobium aquiferis TaxID=1801832 RepID=A0A1G1KRF3_9BACT|nr:MAG: hypothetical protein A3E74_08055 [Omnitrophica bacterium RIFCSPHIGHO2_12_FULL_44_12]OGW95516.1 MAG: hypothetical protein A3G33_02690 [Omnitrophica bacterium RIFCSPLOWO2_12_FULL_44_17]OGX01608.1 MAG: hypothetical protein A3J12_05785 [Omnitrophica bacterium RIFCSPLOWO2_02_FULL_44_11]